METWIKTYFVQINIKVDYKNVYNKVFIFKELMELLFNLAFLLGQTLFLVDTSV